LCNFIKVLKSIKFLKKNTTPKILNGSAYCENDENYYDED